MITHEGGGSAGMFSALPHTCAHSPTRHDVMLLARIASTHFTIMVGCRMQMHALECVFAIFSLSLLVSPFLCDCVCACVCDCVCSVHVHLCVCIERPFVRVHICAYCTYVPLDWAFLLCLGECACLTSEKARLGLLGAFGESTRCGLPHPPV